ncbi:hypothetical protein E2C01_079009 [Portunus trituberculatus]|uniref:Uncharacterized protein n=1 Tax=Portunus trituberculatus TaxID=210409 RepID=A0A5B7IRQ9_PORTR|nr:hypothetical protein [Portunus trituberculatus]
MSPLVHDHGDVGDRIHIIINCESRCDSGEDNENDGEGGDRSNDEITKVEVVFGDGVEVVAVIVAVVSTSGCYSGYRGYEVVVAALFGVVLQRML